MKKGSIQEEVEPEPLHRNHHTGNSNSNTLNSARIHFPNTNNVNAHEHQHSTPNKTHYKTSTISNAASLGGSSMSSSGPRRRVVSVDAGNTYGSLGGGSSRNGIGGIGSAGLGSTGRRIPTVSMGTSSGSGLQAGRRVASESKESSSRDIQHDSSSADSGWGGIAAFSDEYDLCELTSYF
ncbi:hypothetical protein F5890DRAFT_648386 [Lentinula detonsa]|uniref:Uncharacterized protein n=1 Tax=Lentinula detonsa TaxID=2804962 RepID=A0AA38PSA2_9AGAR|nr:hypothetical protein F5890DRAFT_648386 [Lentinula detonsa]